MSNTEARERIWDDFADAVNMSAKQLSRWLETDRSKSAGEGSGESKGHRSGRHIVKILESPRGKLTDEDYDHMRKVVAYVRRHRAQRPSGDIGDTKWRYSLMNWGHDPLNE